MSSATRQSISSQIRDLQGFCRITGNNFGEQDEMRQVFGEICENLDQILTGMAEPSESTNGPSNNHSGSNRALSLIQ
jgi:hypothetical protein